MSVAPRVTVVIPTWNGRELLELVMPSLERQEYGDFDTLLIDNGSSDGTPDHARERWPWAKVVALPRNVGFAAGVNRGIERARGEYVALINNDMELDPAFLRALVEALDEEPAAASATAKMLSFDDREILDGAGDVLHWSGVVGLRGRGERDLGQYDEPAEVFSACGGAALYRRAAFDEVGSFDEAFFAQMEDVDWGFRARLLGHGCRYVPGAVVYHKGSASMWREGRRDPRFWGMPVRNCIWMWIKNYPRDCLLRNAHLLLAHELAGLYFAVREGMVRAHLRAWRAALRGLPRVLRQRRDIQSRRCIGRRELEQVIRSEPLGWRRAWSLLRSGRPLPGGPPADPRPG